MSQPDPSERFALGHIETTAEGETTIRATVHISREDYERYSAANGNVQALGRAPFIWTHLTRNFNSVEATLDHVNTILSLGRTFRPDRSYLVETLGGQIVNWLAAMRLYLDHTDHQLKERFGEKSPERKRFKAATSIAFDESFAYRFLYKFRDHVLHRGFPLSHLSLTANGVGQPATVEFLLVRDDLLKDKKWGEPVSESLREAPPEFPLRPLIREAMDRLTALHLLAVEIDIRRAASTIEVVAEAVARLPDEPGVPTLFKIRGDAAEIHLDGVESLQVAAVEGLRPVADGTVDPSTMVRIAEPDRSAIDPAMLRDQLHPNNRGVQAISAFIAEDAPGQAFVDEINRIIIEDDGPDDLITGLATVSGLLLNLSALTMGVDAKGLLGTLHSEYVDHLDQSDTDAHDSDDNTS